jgi:aminoglycoside phosphotransferase (APT) family kinase protein
MAPMSRTRMHADEVLTDEELVRRLVAAQFPQWAGLPVEYVTSYGTDNDIYRLGDELSVRLPRISGATGQAAKEARWLPRLADALPVLVPVHLEKGLPDAGYPYEWAVYRWLPGSNAAGGVADAERLAVEVSAFLTALRRIDTAGAPRAPAGSRGGPVGAYDEGVRRSVAELGERIDGAAALRVWADALAAPAWDGPALWLHGDLLPGNVLLVDGGLAAVIDWSCLTTGDPAYDLLPAWSLFAGASRARFRAELSVDDATWRRGRGFALWQAVTALAYYWDTNPGMIRQASHSLEQILID